MKTDLSSLNKHTTRHSISLVTKLKLQWDITTYPSIPLWQKIGVSEDVKQQEFTYTADGTTQVIPLENYRTSIKDKSLHILRTTDLFISKCIATEMCVPVLHRPSWLSTALIASNYHNSHVHNRTTDNLVTGGSM
jgi:hypothetical protein